MTTDASVIFDEALARHRDGRVIEALGGYRRALTLLPAHGPALHHLAYGHIQAGLFEAAERAAARATACVPDATSLLLRAFAELRRPREQLALRWLRRGAALAPAHFDILNNLAVAFAQEDGPQATATWAGRALSLAPASPEARLNRANAWIALGRWRDAWPDYDLRLLLQQSYPHAIARPRWDGSVAPAARLLVHDEIGYGDVFNFLRYVPMARARVGSLIFEVKPGLGRLLSGCPGVDRLVERGPQPLPASDYDLSLPLESLPGLFGTTPTTVPPSGPPLRPDPLLRTAWRHRLGHSAKRRVALVWAGSPGSGLDRNRSCSLSDLAPLASLPDVEWISLQKGPAAADLARGGFGAPVVDLGEELADFADTAAVLEEVDVVVAVETAVAHLSGLLGRPTCILLSRWPAGRWLLGRSDTPWYPSVTLYRQRIAGDWTEPVHAIRKRLKDG